LGPGKVLENRKRFPHAHHAVDQGRHLAGAGDLQQPLLEVRRVERDHGLGEWDAGDLHGDPRPHRPGRIILVADGEMKRHSAHSYEKSSAALPRGWKDSSPPSSASQAAHLMRLPPQSLMSYLVRGSISWVRNSWPREPCTKTRRVPAMMRRQGATS